MNWFNNLKIKTKLITSFIIVAVFTAIVGVMGIINMNTLSTRGDELYTNNFLPAQGLANIQKSLQEIRANHLVLLYEKNPNTFDQGKTSIDQEAQHTNNLLEEYKKTINKDEELGLYNNIVNSLEIYREARDKNLGMIERQRYEEALGDVPNVTEAREKTDEALQALIDYNTMRAEKKVEDNQASFQVNSSIMIVLALIAVGLAVGLGLLIATVISKPLIKLVGIVNKVAEKDLDVVIDIQGKDEVGILAGAIKTLTNNLNMIMTNINSSAEQVASGSQQVSDSSMALSQGATEQASSIEQLTTSLEEISSQTRQNAQNANEANELAEKAKANAVQGNRQMEEMLNAMEEINDSSGNISKIIKVIDEIAFQTNILALNAAVEAARAGQHGKGFAVVAEEVRNLAARSANAAKETTAMIEGSIKKVEGGTKIANETADALNQIVEDVAKVANLVSEIAIASNEQATGIEQINQGISQVSEVVQSNSATSEESAAASEELSGQATMLEEMVSEFNLKKIASSRHKSEEVSPEVLEMLDRMSSKKTASRKDEYEEKTRDAKTKILLSDKEFGKY